MWTLAMTNSIASAMTAAVSNRSVVVPAPQMDVLMVFGFLTSFLTLVVWIYQNESRASFAALATGLAALAVYAFLQGAWPAGMALAVWSAARFRQSCAGTGFRKLEKQWRPAPMRWNKENRIDRLFGKSQLN